MHDYTAIISAQVAGDMNRGAALIREALDAGRPAGEILERGLIVAMNIVGEKMESGEMYIPEVLMAARSMSSAMEILKPFVGESPAGAPVRVVIGTVKGDMHDIGKNLVVLMMEGAGFEVIDLGVDVSPKAFVEEVRRSRPHILALSALLTTTMPLMKQTIDALVENGVREGVRVLVGGAPVTRQFAEQIGADGYAAEAGAAVRLVRSLL